jgi:thioredoxin 1
MQYLAMFALVGILAVGGYLFTRQSTPSVPTATMNKTMEQSADVTGEMTKTAPLNTASDAMKKAEESADSMSNTMTKEMAPDAMMKKDAMNSDTMVKTDATMSKDAMEAKSMTDIKSADGAMVKQDAAMMGHGSYEAYAASKLAMADTGKVVLFFRASWCPTCKALDADIKKNAMSIPKGVTILDVDYDTSADLKKKYGVTYQHTLVQVDSKGTQLMKWQGSPTLAALVGKIK